MIQSIFLWLRANPSLLCHAWNIHTPAVAWQGSRKSFSLLLLLPLNNQTRCPSSVLYAAGITIWLQHMWRNFYLREILVCRQLLLSILSFFSPLSDSTLAAAYWAASLSIPEICFTTAFERDVKAATGVTALPADQQIISGGGRFIRLGDKLSDIQYCMWLSWWLRTSAHRVLTGQKLTGSDAETQFLLHFFISGEKRDTRSLKDATLVFKKGSADIIDFYIITDILPTWGQWKQANKQVNKTLTYYICIHPSCCWPPGKVQYSLSFIVFGPHHLLWEPSSADKRSTMFPSLCLTSSDAEQVMFLAHRGFEGAWTQKQQSCKKTNKFKLAMNLSRAEIIIIIIGWLCHYGQPLSYHTFN